VVRKVRGIINMGHMFNHMCPGFLRMYFPDAWIRCVEIWAKLAMREIDLDDCDVPTSAYIQVTWHERARLITADCQDGSMHRFTPLDRVFRNGDSRDFIYYYSHETELQAMFPAFLTHNWLEQAQMVMTLWFLRNRDLEIVDLHIWLYMLHVGGCFPNPILNSAWVPMTEGKFKDIVLIAPAHDTVRPLDLAETLPRSVLQSFPYCADLSAYSVWRDKQQGWTREERRQRIARAGGFTPFPLTSDRASIPPSYQLHIDRGYEDDYAIPDDHVIFAELALMKTWYSSEPQTQRLERFRAETVNRNTTSAQLEHRAREDREHSAANFLSIVNLTNPPFELEPKHGASGGDRSRQPEGISGGGAGMEAARRLALGRAAQARMNAAPDNNQTGGAVGSGTAQNSPSHTQPSQGTTDPNSSAYVAPEGGTSLNVGDIQEDGPRTQIDEQTEIENQLLDEELRASMGFQQAHEQQQQEQRRLFDSIRQQHRDTGAEMLSALGAAERENRELRRRVQVDAATEAQARAAALTESIQSAENLRLQTLATTAAEGVAADALARLARMSETAATAANTAVLQAAAGANIHTAPPGAPAPATALHAPPAHHVLDPNLAPLGAPLQGTAPPPQPIPAVDASTALLQAFTESVAQLRADSQAQSQLMQSQFRTLQEDHLTHLRAQTTAPAGGSGDDQHTTGSSVTQTTDEWVRSDGSTVQVDPRNPPPWLHRAYGRAGATGTITPQTPLPAPMEPLLTMHDSIRTTAGSLGDQESISDDSVCARFINRLQVYVYPEIPSVGEQVLVSVAPANKEQHTYCTEPPISFDKLERTALAFYTVRGIDTHTQGWMILGGPEPQSGAFDQHWPLSLSWHTPSMYIPYMLVIHPENTESRSGEKAEDGTRYLKRDRQT
jgi:hypothetical protein